MGQQLHRLKSFLLSLEWRLARSSFLFERLEGASTDPRSVKGCRGSSPASPHWQPVPSWQIANGYCCHTGHFCWYPDKSVIFMSDSAMMSPIRCCWLHIAVKAYSSESSTFAWLNLCAEDCLKPMLIIMKQGETTQDFSRKLLHSYMQLNYGYHWDSKFSCGIEI